MRILVAHNYYQQPGGEDAAFAIETAALGVYGHKVVSYTRHNNELNGQSGIRMAVNTVWNHSQIKPLQLLIREHQIEVVHFHNTFPSMSPAVYWAVRREGVPVVQSLHNFRLICLNGLLFRDGEPCEDCILRRSSLPGIYHACYRHNTAASTVTATMLEVHRLIRTWANAVDIYIALTDFAKQKFIDRGLPADKIQVKSNFIYPDPGIGFGNGGYALFVGRLSEEKGIATLIAAWRRVAGKLPLKIVGDGPLAPLVAEASRTIDGVQWLGHQDKTEVYRLMGDAKVLVIPSEYYEGMPLTLLESFAKGTPVISSNIGAVASININEYTGIHFSVGIPDSLVDAINWVLANSDVLPEMRLNARAEFEAKYSVEQNIAMLVNIYELARRRSGSTRSI
jgi:glycosyltransferase involved in cell wall biosynthesis